jgi:Protein of unknown function (DUF2530)
VQPLDVDGVRTAWVGTAVWLVAFVVLLPFHGRLADDGRAWWLWTCLVGAGLGLVAVWITTRHRGRLRGQA